MKTIISNGLNTKSIKSLNTYLILRHLLYTENPSRSQLTQITQLSPTTITNLINELMEQNIVIEAGIEDREQMGRPRKILKLVPESRYAVGVHIGVGYVDVGITNILGEILAEQRIRFETTTPHPEVLAQITESALTLLERFDHSLVIGVGVGALGLVNPATGVNIFAPNLGWHNVPVLEYLEQHLKLPVCVDNNVRLMALSEAMFGRGQDISSLAYIQVQQGVGAGFFINGQLYRGNLNTAGEIGHTRMVINSDTRCSCGNKGCLETLVAEPYLLQQARIHRNVKTFEEMVALAEEGDQYLLSILEQSARYLGVALANLINTFSPNLILIGGLYTKSKDLMLPIVQNEVRKGLFADIQDDVEIRIIAAERKPGLIGAAAFALDQYFYHITQPLEIVQDA